MTSSVVTRFAPSPTGSIHLGSIRTALINWIFARKNKGLFLLRIEDTDSDRNLESSKDEIVSAFQWLNLKWDGKIIFQSQNQRRHQEVAKKLFEGGKAYTCECSARKNRPSCPCRKKNLPLGSGAMRFKVPTAGALIVKDLIKKPTTFQNKHLRDWVILREDQSPTYMLSVVVDDHDMGVTHVVRGDDHFMNTPKQVHMYQALNWEVPVFCHLPLILDSEGRKMSKRDSSFNMDFYKQRHLPEALINYLLTLGTPYDKPESMDQVLQDFDIKKISSSAPRFDQKKLNFISRQELRRCDQKLLFNKVKTELERINRSELSKDKTLMLEKAIPWATERGRDILELAELTEFILYDGPIDADKSDEKLLKTLRSCLEKKDVKSDSEWREFIKEFTATAGVSMEDFSSLARKVFTNKNESISIASIFLVLGKYEVLRKLDQILYTES